MDKEEIVKILSDVPQKYCWLRGGEVGDDFCKKCCSYFKGEKCTFNIWKWKIPERKGESL